MLACDPAGLNGRDDTLEHVLIPICLLQGSRSLGWIVESRKRQKHSILQIKRQLEMGCIGAPG